MPGIFRKVARGEMELEEARRLLDESAKKAAPVTRESLEAMPLESGDGSGGGKPAVSMVTQQQLAGWCPAHPAAGMRVRVVPEPGTETVVQDGTRACLAINWTNVPAELGIGPIPL